ncbi:MAG: hypothetical protein KAT47_04165 [Candidatus Aegiribacteria sp.]|nr:hypothetical protein [Candidatus Aegiribacteria sp.]
MRWIPLLMVALLPSVLLAGVTVSTSPANVDTFVTIAREAMEDENYVTAFALYECALRRDPHSSAALAGRLAARAHMEEYFITELMVASR